MDNGGPIKQATMAVTLADLLSNSLVLRQTAPYLPVSALFALSSTCKELQRLTRSPDATRHVDLSPVKSAISKTASKDSGGSSWRGERMDEALTEDEIYSGPLRGIMSKLARHTVLRNISTLILDGLTVPTDMVRELISDPQYNVRILSIREVKHLNERKLMQVLKYAVRPTRPSHMPKLRGLYVFGPMDQRATSPEAVHSRRPSQARTPPMGVTNALGASLGAEWNKKSEEALKSDLCGVADKWYQPSGNMFRRTPLADWAETLSACQGIIHFDAVLCRGPRHNADNYKADEGEAPRNSQNTYLPPAVATVALGPDGCATCKSSPEGPARFGKSPAHHLPLLSPPPLHSASIRAAQWPHSTAHSSTSSNPPALHVRCAECLKNRWCERCHKWWDEKCYMPSMKTEMHTHELVEWQALSTEAENGEGVEKDQIKMGSKRECWGCGQTCAHCTQQYIRNCRKCAGAYCVVDNEGSTHTRCDWCNNGRRTMDIN